MPILYIIICVIIIFLIYRHFKNKKAAAKDSAPNRSGSAVGVDTAGDSELKGMFGDFPPYAPPLFVPEHRGTAVSDAGLPQKAENLREEVRSRQNRDPGYVFACAKKLYDMCLADGQSGRLSIGKNDKRIQDWFFAGRSLARFYLTGYGCDRDPEAALKVMLPTLDFIEQENKRGNVPNYESVTLVYISASMNFLSVAECYACVGKEREAAKYYRMAYDTAKIHDSVPDRFYKSLDHGSYPSTNLFREMIITSAMGGYPLPSDPDVAAELALKMIQQNNTFGAYAMQEILELRQMEYGKIGKSYEQDLEVFLSAAKKTGGAYAAYKSGACYLYGKGTKQNVGQGLKLLYHSGCANDLNAVKELHRYFDQLRAFYNTAKGEKLSYSQSVKVNDLAYNWGERVSALERNGQILALIQNVIDGHEGAEALIGKRVVPAEVLSDNEEREVFADPFDAEEASDFGGDMVPDMSAFDIRNIPTIVYDDSNRPWKRRGIYGDHADYYNDDGDQVTIYSAQISGTSASTSAGNLHWY